MKKIKAKIIYWIERIKRIGRITKRNILQYRDDLRWEISHPYFYAQRISDQKDKLSVLDNPHATPPLPKEAFPYNSIKANEALNEVNRWIVKDIISEKAKRKKRDKN